MADITFTIEKTDGKKATGRLKWTAKGLDSEAISGPYGNGYLPNGTYTAKRSKLVDECGGDAYKDPKGKCWFQAILPDFQTTRTGLGIHPDGNVAGTEGCIGVLDQDTKPWYDALFAVSGSVKVEVSGG